MVDSMQVHPGIDAVLARLRRAALAAQQWPELRWKIVSGPGPDTVDLVDSTFRGLTLQPGQPVTLSCDLALPEQIAATPIAGDSLDARVFSLYPTTLYWNDVPLLEEELPSVALGPALVRICSDLRAGRNGEVRMTIRPPANQMTEWHTLTFSTPRLRRRFALLDTAWARLALAAELAATDEERAAVRRAATLVPADLDTLAPEALERHLAAVAEALTSLSARLAHRSVHVVGHSHIDMNWLWTWPDTRAVIKRDMRSVLALMDDYPEMTFTHSQPATYAVLQQEAPDLFARAVARIREGRWEAATMTWVEGDTNMASGEAMARQLLEGVHYAREQLGVQPTVFLAPDTFGHAGTLPQLAVSAGASAYYHHRCNPGPLSAEQTLWPAYWWEGQDGSRLLAISTPSYNGEITAGALAQAALMAHRQGQSTALLFHGVGDHGGGPTRLGLDTLRRLQGESAFLSARCSTIAAYARELLQSGAALPTHRGELNTIFEGCYTTQSEMKRFNRQGENLLCTADTLAALVGLSHRPAMADAWHRVLFHQFHDILDGSAIHESYRQSAEDFQAVRATATAVIEEALPVLEGAIPGGQIAVTNPLGWDRQDVVIVPGLQGEGATWLRDTQGRLTPGQYTAHGLCFLAHVPAFGTIGYQVIAAPEQLLPPAIEAVPAHSPAALAAAGGIEPQAEQAPYYRIETPGFRVYVRRDSGVLVSFYDKRAARELVGFGMRRSSDYPEAARTDLALNVLQVLDELPHEMSAWHLDEVQRETSLLRGATTRVVESGPVRLVLEVRHQVRSSTITQLIAFYRELPRVDVETTIDWREQGGPEAGVANLKVAFTTQLDECRAWFESPFGAVRRPADGQEVPALRWADVGGREYGLAVLNDSRYGYDALGTRLRLTLIRGAYEPDALADQGEHHTRYRLLPHQGDWRDAGVVRQAAGFNQPLLARVVPAQRGAPPKQPAGQLWQPRLSEGSVAIACLKPAHEGHGRIVRLYETAGRGATATLSGLPVGAQVSETTIVEDRLRPLVPLDGNLVLHFRPWQVRTVLVQE